MKSLKGHFDGRVVVLDEPADLELNQAVTVFAHPARPGSATVAEAARLLGGAVSDADAAEMAAAIDGACEEIEPEADAPF